MHASPHMPVRLLGAYLDLARRSYEQIKPNIAAIGWFGAIGFPLYYVIWAYLVPQPYEELTSRLIGAALCLGLALSKFWPRQIRGFLPAYWYLSAFYALPFFFNYMLFRNDFSVIWLLSTLIGVVLLVLLVDWASSLMLFAGGVAAAGILAQVNAGVGFEIYERYVEYLPIFLFALIAGSVFNYKSELLRRERLKAAHQFGDNLARELRPSLMGVRAGILGLEKFMPELVRAYQTARNSGLPVPRIETRELIALEGAVGRIRKDVEHATTLFDMVATDGDKAVIDPQGFRVASIADTVDQALASYPFRSDKDRGRIVWKRDGDFAYLGNDGLMNRALLMILKNSLYGLGRAGQGDITILIGTGAEENYLFVRQTGSGIPAGQIAGLFDGNSKFLDPTLASSGGLAFCRTVLEAMGGEIYCRSELGRFTEYQLRFPAVRRPKLKAVSGDRA